MQLISSTQIKLFIIIMFKDCFETRLFSGFPSCDRLKHSWSIVGFLLQTLIKPLTLLLSSTFTKGNFQ